MSYTVTIKPLDHHLWKAWMNTVHDYENNVLKGKRYPSKEKIQKQKKEKYNFLLTDMSKKTLQFESEKDFMFFMLKWG
jgi:hypothetical protein